MTWPAYVVDLMRDLAPTGLLLDLTGVRDRRGETLHEALRRALSATKPGTRIAVFATNSFAKRAYGKAIAETLLARDLTHVIDLGGCYIRGQGVPTMVLSLRNDAPLSSFVRVVRGLRGEPREPEDPARGIAWASISEHIDMPGHGDDYARCADVPRDRLADHPWSFGGLVPDPRDERCPDCNGLVAYPAPRCWDCGPWDERHGSGSAGPIDDGVTGERDA